MLDQLLSFLKLLFLLYFQYLKFYNIINVRIVVKELFLLKTSIYDEQFTPIIPVTLIPNFKPVLCKILFVPFL